MLKYYKVFDVKSPSRGTTRSAGIDFYVPEFTEEFKKLFIEKNPTIAYDSSQICLYPHERVNIPSGIKAEIPEGYALIAFNKSGIATKLGLDIGASVVDEDYTGMIHISLTNTTNNLIRINYGQKIVQFILIPVNYAGLLEVDSEDILFTRASERGAGGFGSTGLN